MSSMNPRYGPAIIAETSSPVPVSSALQYCYVSVTLDSVIDERRLARRHTDARNRSICLLEIRPCIELIES